MKKKITQKLMLSKETLRNLSERELNAAVGGDHTALLHCRTEADTCTGSSCPSNWTQCC